MKSILYIIIGILCISSIWAYEYPIDTIQSCVGDITIKTQGDYTRYTITGCIFDKYWKCKCQNPTNIIIDIQDEEIENRFDFTIYYYVEDTSKMSDIEKSNAERKKIVTKVGFHKEEDKKVSSPLNKNIIIAIVIVVVLIGLVGMFFIGKHFYKKIMRDDENG